MDQERWTRLTCHAPHPDPKQPEGTHCGRTLIPSLPAKAHFVRTVPKQPTNQPRRELAVRCTRHSCEVWNIFELDEED